MAVLFEHDYNRHMPFIFEGNKLIYCRASCEPTYLEEQGVRQNWGLEPLTPYRAYDICVADINLETNEVSNELLLECCHVKNVHCSPSAYRDAEGVINLVYVKEDMTSTRKPFYNAWRRKGESFETMGKTEKIKPIVGMRTYCYAENNRFRVVASSFIGNAFILVVDKEDKLLTKYSFGSCTFLRRVSLVSESNKLLLTYPTAIKYVGKSNGVYNTSIFDLETEECFRITGPEQSIYKSTIYGDKLIQSVQSGDHSNYCMDLNINDFSTVDAKIKINKRIYSEVCDCG